MIKLMEKTLFAVALFVLGLILGSFVNAAVWRLKKKKDLLIDRSECTKCHYKLAWYDLIPVLSWVFLKGKCRKCHKPISPQYPIVELSLAAFFVASLAFWPYELNSVPHLLHFAIWLIAGVGLAILFVYDLRWLLLPDRVVFPLIGLGVGVAILKALEAESLIQYVLDVGGSLLILSGLYFALFVFSSGRWVGFGDVKLGLALALLLSNWQLALLALFLANLAGTLFFTPALLFKKVKRSSHVPFGPFLIIGFILAGLFGHSIVDWYTAMLYGGIQVPHEVYSQ